MRLTLATWNIQGADPGYVSQNDLVQILRRAPMQDTARNPNKKNIPDGASDIYVVGLQEVIPMDRSVKIPLPKLTFRGSETLDLTRADLKEKVQYAWTDRLVPACNEIGARYGARYVKLATNMLNGVAIFVIVRQELIREISAGLADSVRTEQAPSDLEILMLPDNEANGAVAIRFEIGASSLAFVNCQLRRGEGFAAVAERNRQFKKIASEMFADRGLSLAVHEFVFWMGDLNYKIVTPSLGSNVTPSYVWKMAKRGELELLLRADELSAQRASGVAFGEYREGVPNFPPTYPVQSWLKPGQPRPTTRKKLGNGLKTDDSEIPGWTGRILWRRTVKSYNAQGPSPQTPEFHGGLVAYTRVTNVAKVSQHLPVVAVIDIQLTRGSYQQPQQVFQQAPQVLPQQTMQVQPTYMVQPTIPQQPQPSYWPQPQPQYQIQPQPQPQYQLQPQPQLTLPALPAPPKIQSEFESVFSNFIL